MNPSWIHHKNIIINLSLIGLRRGAHCLIPKRLGFRVAISVFCDECNLDSSQNASKINLNFSRSMTWAQMFDHKNNAEKHQFITNSAIERSQPFLMNPSWFHRKNLEKDVSPKKNNAV